MKEKRFVMLGERDKKGKIVKNESYSVEDFTDKMIDRTYDLKESIYFTLWDRLSWKRFKEKSDKLSRYSFEKGFTVAIEHIDSEIHKLIDKDNFGKKKK